MKAPIGTTAMTTDSLEREVHELRRSLSRHPLYAELRGPHAVRQYMRVHVYAVWDFMSLLKRLQRELTCVELPWRPSPHSKFVTRLINEITLGEESDLGPDGEPCDHFTLYLRAMIELGVETRPVLRFVETLNYAALPGPVARFVHHHIELARSGSVQQVAGAFLYGRETLIPEMFEGLLASLHATECPRLRYYLERHVELDGNEHAQLASRCLDELCGMNVDLRTSALRAGLQSLRLRVQLWDYALSSIQQPGTSMGIFPGA